MREKISVAPTTRERIQISVEEVGKSLVRERVTVTPSTDRAAVSAKPVRSIWEERGWTPKTSGRGTVYTGQFQATSRTGRTERFEGRIETGQGISQAFVRNPPLGLSRHPKGVCFHLIGDGWRSMNWHRGSANIDETIGYVEKVLAEALDR